ncbi:MAG: hypothetical protein RJA76_361 [Bacteroidota bacterium]|jgi:hypothetical protein
MKYLLILTSFLILSCEAGTAEAPKKKVATDEFNQENATSKKAKLSLPLEAYEVKMSEVKAPQQSSTKVLWIGKYGDYHFNTAYLKNISVYERAALGYVATFVGNGCNYEGDFNLNEEHYLKCQFLAELDLGYQCSDRHLGFLRSMFKNDKKALADLAGPCPEIIYGATSQTMLTEISIEAPLKNEIQVKYHVSGVYLRESIDWDYDVVDVFIVGGTSKDPSISLKSHQESEVKYTKFNVE